MKAGKDTAERRLGFDKEILPMLRLLMTATDQTVDLMKKELRPARELQHVEDILVGPNS
jgi:hypothetical protein